jgi:glycosyltransferase involved in cell wall biosynthesis
MLPISVQICTLNEEKNIRECILKIIENGPEEIIVIDGASSDSTRDIASSLGAKVLNVGRIGLAKQRQLGIESTALPYIAIVDADDRIEIDCLNTLLIQLKNGNYSAIQASVQSFENLTYWQKAWGLFCSININDVGPTNIVGRPAIFDRTAILDVGFDPFFTYGSEDTDISYRFEKTGLMQGIGSGISKRIHPSTFNECKKKWISYGRGYYRFVFKHKEKEKSILKHILYNIPIKRSIRTIKNGKLIFIPFNILYGFFTIIGYFYEKNLLRSEQVIDDFGR